MGSNELSAVVWCMGTVAGESVNDALPGRRIGRQLRIMNFRLDGLGSTLDFLPPWASTQVKGVNNCTCQLHNLLEC